MSQKKVDDIVNWQAPETSKKYKGWLDLLTSIADFFKALVH